MHPWHQSIGGNLVHPWGGPPLLAASSSSKKLLRRLQSASRCFSCWYCFLVAFLMGFWVGFSSQLVSNLAPQIHQNRWKIDARMHCILDLIFESIFWWMLAPNLDPRILKNRAPAAGRARFYKNRLSKLTSIFDPILGSTLLHFGIQNPPKSFQKSIPRGTKKLINFGIDF